MKPFLMSFTEPIGLFWLLLVGRVAWHLWRRHWTRAVWSAGLAAAVFFLAGTNLTARWLASLERPYFGPPLDQVAPADAVVMLGGALLPSAHDAFGLDLNSHADRVVTAAELIRRGKGRVLVLSGGGPPPAPPQLTQAELARAWLAAWGRLTTPTFVLPPCADTHEEAVRVQALAKAQHWQRVTVVTSAWHLKRALAVFRHAGVPAAGVGCDFAASAWLADHRPFALFAGTTPLDFLELYLHEKIGWWAYRWRGWID